MAGSPLFASRAKPWFNFSMATAEIPAPGTVTCDECGEVHAAQYSHEGAHGEGPIFSVVCTRDDLFDFYTEERVTRTEAPVAHVEGQMELLLILVPDAAPAGIMAEFDEMIAEVHNRFWTEWDRHGRAGYGQCRCGWEAKNPNGAHANVAVGVHVKMARTKAEKVRTAEVAARTHEITTRVR